MSGEIVIAKGKDELKSYTVKTHAKGFTVAGSILVDSGDGHAALIAFTIRLGCMESE